MEGGAGGDLGPQTFCRLRTCSIRPPTTVITGYAIRQLTDRFLSVLQRQYVCNLADSSDYTRLCFSFKCLHCLHQHKRNKNRWDWDRAVFFTQGRHTQYSRECLNVMLLPQSYLAYFTKNTDSVKPTGGNFGRQGAWTQAVPLQQCNQLRQKR